MNILIVDDLPVNRKLLRITLEAEGHGILEAADGEEALAVLRREKADAVISDILMPNMDGFAFCRRVRETESLHDLPIIVYTSTYNSPSDEALAKMVGADSYLRKPASAQVLTQTLEQVTSKSRNRARAVPSDEVTVMRQYNAVLIHKLEEKNAELETAHAELRESNRLLVHHANELEQLNLSLEHRIAGRTRELETSNHELERANREIQSFYHTLSHELKTPLTSAREFVSILRDGIAGPLNETQMEYLGYIWEGFNQLRVCINDLLDATRLETGKFALELRPTCVEKLIERAGTCVAPHASAKGIDLTWNVQPGLFHVPMDEVRMTQVVTNLLNNALKFTPAGGRVTVNADIDPANPEFLRVSVSDTGKGMAADEIERVFDRLYQIKHGDAATEQGLGLGLYLCRELVRLHDGEIWAESEPGQGSTFTFVISKAQAPQPFRVLVVDDDPGVLKLTKRVLEHAGLRVTAVSSGAEALRAMTEHVPAAVLLDLVMPGFDGAATLREIRKKWGAIPVIIHTGYPDGVALNRALEFSPFTLLAKPCPPDELVATVRSVMKQDERSFRKRSTRRGRTARTGHRPAKDLSEEKPRYEKDIAG